MRQLSLGDVRVIKIVEQKKLFPEADRRLSGFVFVHEAGG